MRPRAISAALAARARRHGLPLGGFNLLPYRARDARRARRRIAGEMGAAVLLGVAGLAVWSALREHEIARIDAQRLAIEARLSAWAPKLADAQRQARERDAARARRVAAAERAVPRARMADLFDVLEHLRYDGVSLESIRADEHGASIVARAASYGAAMRWFTQLTAVRDGWAAEVVGLEPSSAPGGSGARPRGAIGFSVEIRWPSAGARATQAATAGRQTSGDAA